MVDVPNPLRLVNDALRATDATPPEAPAGGTSAASRQMVNVGGRHGSPSIVIGMPFARVSHVEADPALRPAVAALAELTARLADLVSTLADTQHEGTDLDPATIGAAAGELADEARALLASLEDDDTPGR